MAKALIWEFSDADVMDELSRVEYNFGAVMDDGHTSYAGTEPHDRDTAVIASALLRIMKHLKMGGK